MERDDIIEYSLHTHHSEEEGVKIRKKIYKVTAILSIITIVEVVIGVFFSRAGVSGLLWESIKWFYIVLTLVKAAYIVMTFMHLGDENKIFRYLVLIPYLILISQLIIIGMMEGTAIGNAFSTYGV